MEENRELGFLYPTLNRNWSDFLDNFNIGYNPSINEFDPRETANYIARKGVFERVGEFDMLFPHEFNERDWLVRAKKMGISLGTTSMKLFYHPDHSQDDPNRQGVSTASSNFTNKHGSNWEDAIKGGGFEHPFNDPTKKWSDVLQDNK